MRTYLNKYEQFYIRILEDVGFIRAITLKLCAVRRFNHLSMARATICLEHIASLGYVILTGDGWSLTKSVYRRICDDKDYMNLIMTENERLTDISLLTPTKYDLDVADCMMMVAEMEPLSEEFFLGSSPWYVQFIAKNPDEEIGRLYQITTFRRGNEMAMDEIIRSLPTPHSNGFRKQIRRVAIMDDPDMLWTVPKLGFSHICCTDPETNTSLKMLKEIPVEERWKDLIEE